MNYYVKHFFKNSKKHISLLENYILWLNIGPIRENMQIFSTIFNSKM